MRSFANAIMLKIYWYCIVSVDILFSKNELGGLSYTSENGSCKQMIKPSFLLIMILLFTGSWSAEDSGSWSIYFTSIRTKYTLQSGASHEILIITRSHNRYMNMMTLWLNGQVSRASQRRVHIFLYMAKRISYI